MYIHNWVQLFHNLTANMQIDTIPHSFKVWLHWSPYIASRKKFGDQNGRKFGYLCVTFMCQVSMQKKSCPIAQG